MKRLAQALSGQGGLAEIWLGVLVGFKNGGLVRCFQSAGVLVTLGRGTMKSVMEGDTSLSTQRPCGPCGLLKMEG